MANSGKNRRQTTLFFCHRNTPLRCCLVPGTVYLILSEEQGPSHGCFLARSTLTPSQNTRWSDHTSPRPRIPPLAGYAPCAAGLGASSQTNRGRVGMNSKMNMLYWKSDKFWLGKLLEHPEIMTQGETLEELEANLKEAYLLMALDDVPGQYEIKEIAV